MKLRHIYQEYLSVFDLHYSIYLLRNASPTENRETLQLAARLFQARSSYELWLMFQYAKLLSDNHDLRNFEVSPGLQQKATVHHDLLIRSFWSLQQRFGNRPHIERLLDDPDPLSEPCILGDGTEIPSQDDANRLCELTTEVIPEDGLNDYIFEMYCMQYIDESSLVAAPIRPAKHYSSLAFALGY